MTMRRFLGQILCLSFACSASASVKKDIIENCDRALKALPALALEERNELIPYLREVLKLQTSSIAELPVTGITGEAPFGIDFSRSFEPTRNVQAKRCAVRVLDEFGETALPSVPELILLLGDQSLPDDLRHSAYDTMRNITVSAGRSEKRAVPRELVDRCVALLPSPPCEAVFIELGNKVVPTLLELFRRPDKSRRDDIGRLLLDIDSEGTLIGPGLLALLSSGDDGVRKRSAALLGRLPLYAEDSLPALAERLDDFSTEVQEQSIKAIAQIDRTLGTKVPRLTEMAIRQLIRALRRLPVTEQSAVIEILSHSLPSTPDLVPLLLPLGSDVDPNVRAAAVLILSRVDRTDQSQPVLRAALYDPALPVRLAAIRGLEDRTDEKTDVAAALLRLLKSNAASPDLHIREAILLAAARAISVLQPLPSEPAMYPYLVGGLKFRDGDIIATVLERGGAPALPLVLKELRAPHSLAQRRAAAILAKSNDRSERTIRTVAELLKTKDPAVVSAAVDSLVQMGAPALPALERMLQTEAKLAAAEAIVRIKPNHTRAASICEEILRRASCSERVLLSKLLPKELWIAPLSQCATSDEPFVIEQLLSAAPLSPTIRANIHPMELAPQRRISLLEKGLVLGFSAEELLPPLLALVTGHQDTAALRAVVTLGTLRARDATPALGELIERDSTDPLIRHEAVIALARIDPGRFDFLRFLQDEIKDGRTEWVRSGLARLDTAQSFAVLRTLLKDRKVQRDALTLLGSFGTEAAEFVGDILPFLQNRETRYAATLALLRIDPARPEVIPSLRAVLVSEEGRMLSTEKLPDSVRPLLEQIIAAPESRLETHAARSLLRA